MPELSRLPRGSGQPVMVLQGFATTDASTLVLQAYLRLLGYRVRGWRMGVNTGRISALLPRVITLGTPIAGGRSEAPEPTPIRVPITAIWSRADGIVAWQACVDLRSPDVENIEVGATHIGLGFSPDVNRVIAERLAR